MKMLAVEGKKTTISLTTLDKQHLQVLDLNEDNLIELLTVFSTPDLSVS